MEYLTAAVEIKCRVAGVDPDKPRKELAQRVITHTLKTQVINNDDWWMRRFFAYMILKYGLDWDDWMAVTDEDEWWWEGPDADPEDGGWPGE